MRFTALIVLLISTALATDFHGRQGSSIDWSSLSSALQSITIPKGTGTPTATANLGNLSPPPRSLIQEVISAVPPSVLWQLVNPNQRSSLASSFKAGQTPSWYNNLPTDVKNYMAVVKSQVSEGALTATTGLAYQTADATTTTSGSTASATSTSSEGGAVRAQPTGMVIGGMGALGVLGLALAL